eukprot:8525252-Pyramimonas_sp.AAC.1
MSLKLAGVRDLPDTVPLLLELVYMFDSSVRQTRLLRRVNSHQVTRSLQVCVGVAERMADLKNVQMVAGLRDLLLRELAPDTAREKWWATMAFETAEHHLPAQG